METLTPAQLIQRHLDAVLTSLPGAFDGDVESVHKARIATRRLREALLLTDVPELEQVTARVRAAGRHLGCVRELDVMSSLLASMSDRVPTSAATGLHALRYTVRQRLGESRRTMVKELEELNLSALRDMLAPNAASRLWQWVPRAAYIVAPKWEAAIWTSIGERGADAAAATRRAPAVYFPNRTHRVRIAVKKLRYAVEIAAETGVWRRRNVLKDLREIQQVLGDLHDVQVLLDLASEAPSPDGAAPAPGSPIRELLEAERDRYVSQYAKRRERILHIADVCRRASSRAKRRIPRPLIAGAVLAAPLLLEFVRPARQLIATRSTHRSDKRVTRTLHAAT